MQSPTRQASKTRPHGQAKHPPPRLVSLGVALQQLHAFVTSVTFITLTFLTLVTLGRYIWLHSLHSPPSEHSSPTHYVALESEARNAGVRATGIRQHLACLHKACNRRNLIPHPLHPLHNQQWQTCRTPLTKSLYHCQAFGLMGSPTDPRTLRELTSYLEMMSGP